jgi:hypothetical protein
MTGRANGRRSCSASVRGRRCEGEARAGLRREEMREMREVVGNKRIEKNEGEERGPRL